LVREAEHLHNAMKFSARYLHFGTTREPAFYPPEMGRRMRGADVWAALKSLGKPRPLCGSASPHEQSLKTTSTRFDGDRDNGRRDLV
jgi:hypothetical protein